MFAEHSFDKIVVSDNELAFEAFEATTNHLAMLTSQRDDRWLRCDEPVQHDPALSPSAAQSSPNKLCLATIFAAKISRLWMLDALEDNHSLVVTDWWADKTRISCSNSEAEHKFCALRPTRRVTLENKRVIWSNNWPNLSNCAALATVPSGRTPIEVDVHAVVPRLRLCFGSGSGLPALTIQSRAGERLKKKNLRFDVSIDLTCTLMSFLRPHRRWIIDGRSNTNCCFQN